MKEISRAQVLRATNCNGPVQEFTELRCEVEAADVGKVFEHYLGFRCAGYRIKPTDVGRTAVRSIQPGYSCWWFDSVREAAGDEQKPDGGQQLPAG